MGQTILIVDDEKEIRELLRLYLEREGYTVLQAEDGLAALETQAQTPADLAIIDIMMPALDGYRLIQKLRERSNLPIIVVSAKTENHEKILGLNLGADDYVTKPFDPMEVSARVNAQLRRGGAGAHLNNLLTAGGLSLDMSACVLRCENEVVGLTATEFNIMRLFLQNPGRVFTKQQIYDFAWQESYLTDDNTVMVAISKLRGKFPAECGASIKTIRGLGYRLEVR